MSDDLTQRGPQDRSRINIHEPWEVRYWCQHFGCTEQQLRNAVAAVGVSVSAVTRHLNQR
jgi:hypothetical protein